MPTFKTGDGSGDAVLFVTLPLVVPEWFRIAFMGALREMTIEENWYKENASDADINFARDKAVEMINGIQFNESPPPMREIGEIVIWPNSYPPDKYLYCAGTAISRTIYADLFAKIGTIYGAGDGSTTFNLPNLINKFPKMYNPSPGANSEDHMGGTGGANTITLTEGQMPKHSHQNGRGNPGSAKSSWTAANTANYASFQTSETAGNDEPHENRPPFLSLNFIIYTGVSNA